MNKKNLSITSHEILLVDDNLPNLNVLSLLLEEVGYNVHTASDGQEALDKIQTQSFDLIIMDTGLPVLNAYEVVKQMTVNSVINKTAVILLADHNEVDELTEAFEYGNLDYLTRPINTRELLTRINVHLKANHQENQSRNALDAFGYASIMVSITNGKILWKTPLASELLAQYFELDSIFIAALVHDWLKREIFIKNSLSDNSIKPADLKIKKDTGQLSFQLHSQVEDDCYLVVMRESSDSSLITAILHEFKLTQREAEVLYWLAKGKTNRDIGDIIGASAATVKKHLERVFSKLAVETRTSAAAMVMNRINAIRF